MNHDKHTIEAEIISIIKKIQVFGLITFKGCSTPQEIQNSIEVLRSKTFRSCSTLQKIQ